MARRGCRWTITTRSLKLFNRDHWKLGHQAAKNTENNHPRKQCERRKKRNVDKNRKVKGWRGQQNSAWYTYSTASWLYGPLALDEWKNTGSVSHENRGPFGVYALKASTWRGRENISNLLNDHYIRFACSRWVMIAWRCCRETRDRCRSTPTCTIISAVPKIKSKPAAETDQASTYHDPALTWERQEFDCTRLQWCKQ